MSSIVNLKGTSVMKIVLLENSFVYFAERVLWRASSVVLSGARNVRYWGTTKGLAELAQGPTAKTILDARLSRIVVPMQRVHHVIECKEGLTL